MSPSEMWAGPRASRREATGKCEVGERQGESPGEREERDLSRRHAKAGAVCVLLGQAGVTASTGT